LSAAPVPVPVPAAAPVAAIPVVHDDAPGAAPAASVPLPVVGEKRLLECAHLVPPKKLALASAPYQMWVGFDMKEAAVGAGREEKKAEQAPETLSSELARWFAQDAINDW
jgi:hypothetical protein